MEPVIWLESVRIAMREMRRHPSRSSLTMLGVIFGVGAIIAVVSISQGAKLQIQSQIASIGSNMIIVLPESSSRNGLRAGQGTGNSLSIRDAEAIERECSAIAHAAIASRIITQMVSEYANWTTEVVGVTYQYFDVRAWTVPAAGRIIDRRDTDTAAKVCTLGVTAAEKLFGRADPVGQRIRIQGTPFMVVGVLSPKGQSPTGSDQDDTVLVPLSAAVRYLHGPDRPKAIVVSATSKESVELAMQQMTDLLRQRHQIHGDVDDFTIKSLEEAARMAEDTSNVLTRLLVAIAAISLLVGGIGIMNIMLVTVMERTREIGIRLALGASRQMIMGQFMIEAVTMAGCGGIVGVLVGIAGSRILSQISGWPAIYSPTLLILPLVFALTVGVVFGLLPARRAARMRPVESLRHE